MTKKDYEKIADAIVRAARHSQKYPSARDPASPFLAAHQANVVRNIIEEVAKVFAQDNPRFSVATFHSSILSKLGE